MAVSFVGLRVGFEEDPQRKFCSQKRKLYKQFFYGLSTKLDPFCRKTFVTKTRFKLVQLVCQS